MAAVCGTGDTWGGHSLVLPRQIVFNRVVINSLLSLVKAPGHVGSLRFLVAFDHGMVLLPNFQVEEQPCPPQLKGWSAHTAPKLSKLLVQNPMVITCQKSLDKGLYYNPNETMEPNHLFEWPTGNGSAQSWNVMI